MSYSIVEPSVVEWEIKSYCGRLKDHIKHGFLTTILLSYEDYKRGYIQIGSTCYYLYITVQLENILIDNSILNKQYRHMTLASFQSHTNEANIVLVKAMDRKRDKNVKCSSIFTKGKYHA